MLPLKKDLEGKVLPIKNKNKERVCTREELIFFFKHCFSPKERKIKIILLTQLGCACRIAEACAINLRDFHKGSNFRKVDMLIQKKVKIITLPDGNKKTTGANEIVTKDIPESIAANIRAWVKNNMDSIMYHNGYVFPPNQFHDTPYYKPKTVTQWFSSKRKQLVKLFPGRGFDRTIGRRSFKKNKVLNDHEIPKDQNLYLFSTHLMKRFAGTHGYLLEKDPLLIKEMLCHSNLATTEQSYIDSARVIENNRKAKLVNAMFDINFYNDIKHESEETLAIWDGWKEWKKPITKSTQ